MGLLATACRFLIAAIFLVASLSKFFDIAQSRRSLREFGVPPSLAEPLGIVLPLAEILVAGASFSLRPHGGAPLPPRPSSPFSAQ